SASPLASTASQRYRSTDETPLARKVGSAPSRSASHSSVSAVGLVLPRSIWLTYSLENRPPASSVWERPAATRSRRTRSPGAAASLVCCSAASGVVCAAISMSPNLSLIPGRTGSEVTVADRHFTLLLDFSGHGSYSRITLQGP